MNQRMKSRREKVKMIGLDLDGTLLNDKNIGDELAKKSNEAVISYCKFSVDSKFENPDLQANPDGVYYKVFGKLSAREKTPAEAADELIKGVNECLGN